MHEAVFEAGWKYEKLMEQHRRVISPLHQGKGREIIALDWTFSYHPQSEKIFAAKEAYDYVNRCWSCYQTVVTASISNSQRDALHWDASRVFVTWTYRWSVEIFHEFSKQLVGFESAQLRNEEAYHSHFCLSCVAQSVLQTANCSCRKSERFNLTPENESTIGQRLYSLTREALHNGT